MRNICTVFRRELAAYFTSPVGYVFLAAFLLFTNLLALFVFPPAFFTYPIADMRVYFHVLAGVSAFLVAAVTMRLWAEDRKGNTYELLLTLPLRARELVLGKFFAAWVFYAVGLVLTLSVPLMMILAARPEAAADYPWHGLLDLGATASGYLGALLLGGLFIAFGLLVSGLCSDQIVAFVLTAPTLFFVYLLGLPSVAQAADQALSFLGAGVGTALGQYMGVFPHFDNLARGLLDLGDVLFFLVWTVLFLLLNALCVERRGRTGSTTRFAAAVVLALAVGGAANWMFTAVAFPRGDLTSEGAFTVAPVSGVVLSALPERLRIRYHVSPKDKLPVNMQELERGVRDKLDALNHASGGKIAYQVVYREVAEADAADEDEAAPNEGIERQLFRKIKPFPVQAMEGGKATAQLVYSALEITYPSTDREPEILPYVLPESNSPQMTGLSDLEHRVVRYARNVTRTDKPVIAFYAPVEEVDPQMAMLYMQMGRQPPPPRDPWAYLPYGLTEMEGATVNRVKLTQAEPLPDEYDLLVVVGPEELAPRQQYEINLALAKGKPVVLAVQRFTMAYEANYDYYVRRLTSRDPGIDEWLPEGLAVSRRMVLTENGEPLDMMMDTPFGPMPQRFPAWPMHLKLSGDAFAGAAELTRNVPWLRMFWASELEIDQEKLAAAGLTASTALRAPANSWTALLSDGRVRDAALRPPAAMPAERPVLGTMVTGTFPLRFDKKPGWAPTPAPMGQPPSPPEPDGPVDAFTPAPGLLFLLGGAAMWQESMIQYPELGYFLNVAAQLTLEDTDRAIRALGDKRMAFKMMGPLSKGEERGWKALQVAGHATLLTAIGLLVWWRRRQRRLAYAASVKG